MADEMSEKNAASPEKTDSSKIEEALPAVIPPAPDDSIAVLILDPGAPNSPDEIRQFLRRAYEDKRVFDSPLGALGRGIFTKIFRPCAAGELQRALTAAGDSPNLLSRLMAKAEALCGLLNSMEGMPKAVPFAASLFSEPTLSQTMDEIRGGEFSSVVIFWHRPFASSLINTATDILLRDAEEHPGTPPSVLVHSWMNENDAIAPIAASINSALNEIPESSRAAAHIVLMLRALPVQGSFDPALKLSRKLAASAIEKLKIQNEFSVVYLDGIEPCAPLRPDFDDLLLKLGNSKPHLICIPLMGLCEDLAVLGGIRGGVAARAQKKGFPPITFAKMPFDDDSFLKMAADAIVSHMKRSIEFSLSAEKPIRLRLKEDRES